MQWYITVSSSVDVLDEVFSERVNELRTAASTVNQFKFVFHLWSTLKEENIREQSTLFGRTSRKY
jgi:hypothetical protein